LGGISDKKLYETFTTTSGFTLENASGKDIIPSVVQTGEDVKFYKVGLSVEGNGEVTGVNTYAIGEYAKVTAHPASGEKFLGWYENGRLVSGEAEYRFCVKKILILLQNLLKIVARVKITKRM